MIRSAAIDLGSTLVKASLYDDAEGLGEPLCRPAPPLGGSGVVREGDPLAYAAVADELLDELARRAPPGAPIGIASQRSTFLLWERTGGEPLTPMISWQDRRAAGWCAANRDREDDVVRRTGLVLSAHYAGPKLAVTPELKSGGLFGTLESYLVWRRSGGRAHETDLTMAARTAMLDLATGGWSQELLELYGVPPGCLPEVVPTAGRSIRLDNGLRVTATIADQAAGALALMPADGDCAVVNLGTGAFVLRSPCDRGTRIGGYLTAPALGRGERRGRYLLEGAINGAGSAVDRFGQGPTRLPEADPAPDAFALPDAAGLGAPYWRPELGLTFSEQAPALDEAQRRRVVLEGILFRVRQILDGLSSAGPPRRVLLAGGLSREPFVAAGLAALLGRGIERLESGEAALLGAARLAAGLDPFASPETVLIRPGSAGTYLRSKYARWLDWLDGNVVSQ